VSTGVAIRMRPVRAGIIDVGSNTLRLLVAEQPGRTLETIVSERTYVGLASDIEQTGAISAERLGRVAKLAARYSRLAREHDAEQLEVLVTAPGRQSANAAELRDLLAESSGAPVRQLSAEEEGGLAYAGAVGACRVTPETVAVVDVGGGSTQVIVGTEGGPAWLRCLDLGSLRLTERFLATDPPAADEQESALRAVAEVFDSLTPPLALGALATGGTARTLRRIVGRRLGEKNLSAALEVFATRPAKKLVRDYDIPPERARVLLAGTLVLREAHRRFGVKLEVARGGVREGAVRSMLAELAAAAA
jgi:exopolyphosphatase / guanosine-5'-triphosphate,3'-diphosphate pyrophosphatase